MKRWTKRIVAVCMAAIMSFGSAVPTHATESGTSTTSYSLTFDNETDDSEFSGSGWSVADNVYKATATWSANQLTKVLPLDEDLTVSFDFYMDYNGDWAGSLLGFGFMNSELNSGTFGWMQRTIYGDLLTWRKDGVNGPTSNTAVGDQIVRSTDQIDAGNSAFGSVHTVKIMLASGIMSVYVDGALMSCTNGATVACDITEGYFTLLATNTTAYIDNLIIDGLPSESTGDDTDDDTESTLTDAEEMFGYYDTKVMSTSTKTCTVSSSGTLSGKKELQYWPSSMAGAEYIAFDVKNDTGGTTYVGAQFLIKRSDNVDTTYGTVWMTGEGLECYLIDSEGAVTKEKMNTTAYFNWGGVTVPTGFDGTVLFPVESFEQGAYRYGSNLGGYTADNSTLPLSRIYRFDTVIFKVSGETYTADSTITTSNLSIYGTNLPNVDTSAKRTIQAIRNIGTVTAASENLIVFARETYDALTDTQKAQVTNYDVLTKAENTFAELNDYSGYIGTDGKDFTDIAGVAFNEVFDSAPSTVSAWIKVDKDIADSTHIGTIAGTLDKTGSGSGNTQGVYETWNSFNFEVTTNGNLQVIWRVSKAVKAVFLVDNVDVRTGNWMHVAFTRDVENQKLCVYVNGVLAQAKEVYDGTIADITMRKEVMIGSDYTDNHVLAIGEDPIFKGSIAGVNLYSATLCADEIMTDIKGEMTTGLLGSVDFKSGDDGVYFNTVGEEVTEAFGWQEVSDDFFAADDDEFTLAVFPDTQMLLSKARDASGNSLYKSGYDETTNSFYKNVQWLIKNKDAMNLEYVLHVGDLTDNGNNTDTASYTYTDETGTEQTTTRYQYAWEYEYGLDWMDDLIENGIPYALARGNHETKSNFQEYYTAEEYAQYTMDDFTVTDEEGNETTITGMYSDSSMLNVAYTFEACGQKYLIVTLDLETTNAAVEWANQLIAAMPEYRTIILTHKYMDANGNLYTSALSGGTNYGTLLWDKLISLHENIFLVINGHASGTNIVKRTDVGVNGNTVYQYMIDESHMGYYGSTQPGTFALLKFSDGGDTIQFNFYSANYGKLFRSKNQFTISLDGKDYVEDTPTSKNGLTEVELPTITAFQGTNSGDVIYPTSTASSSNKVTAANFGMSSTAGYVYVIGFDVEKDGVFQFTDTSYIKTNDSAWMHFSVYVVDGSTQETLRWFPKDGSNAVSVATGKQGEVKNSSYGYEYRVAGSSQSYYLNEIGELRVNEGDKIIIAFRSGNTNYVKIAGTITEDSGTETTYDAIESVMNGSSDTASKTVLQNMYNAGWGGTDEDGTPKNYEGWTVGWFTTKTVSSDQATPYKYLLSIQDQEGNTISSRPAPIQVTLPELSRTGHVFLGYEIDGALYPAGYVLDLTADKTIKAIFADFTTFNSASVRMNEPTGLRFSTQLNDEDYTYLTDTLGADIQMGSYIAMASSITTDAGMDYTLLHGDAEFTKINVKSTVQVTAQNGYVQFNSVVVGLSESLYATEFVGRGYMTISYADQSSKTFYARVADNARSVAEVSQKAIDDVSLLQSKGYSYKSEAGYSPYSIEQLSILYGFIVGKELPDFVVNVEAGRDPIVLQLTDTQIIDAAQERYEDRLGATLDAYWATDMIEERCYDYLTETINATNPDLIIITGDLVYGQFDDTGSALISLIEFMDSFEIPWAPIFGNHENESYKGVDWQCEQLENAKYCLFDQKTLTGNGNYSVGIMQNDTLTRVFYMLDSNGCGGASSESLANGHTQTTAGFGADQIAWYTEQIQAIKEDYPNVKLSFAYHIQQSIFADAYAKYGFTNSDTISNPINIDLLESKEDGDFGYIGRDLKGPWDSDYSVWNGMKALGVDSVFVGHEHCNSASVVYDGVRFQFGQKSSTYDRANYVDMSTGTITGSYSEAGTPLVGGTVMVLSEADGSMKDAYIYLCEEAGGNIDWSQWETDEEEEESDAVSGLQYGTDLTLENTSLTVTTVKHDDGTNVSNAYQVTAKSQGKLFVNTDLFADKTKFTFSVYVPSTSTATMAGNHGEFAIRVKPTESEPALDGSQSGYIDFSSNSDDSAFAAMFTFDTWMTYTIDVSGMDETCTEFAFLIAEGNTIYLKDISFE